MEQPYEQVWTNHYQQSKPTTGAQKPDVCGCHGEHLEGCSNAGRPFKPTTGQEWTAEKLYEAVCLKGYYNLAQELNASIAAERKAANKIGENARQLHIYNQQLRSQLIVQQKLWHLLSAAPVLVTQLGPWDQGDNRLKTVSCRNHLDQHRHADGTSLAIS